MFNVYSYDRKLAQTEDLSKMKEDFIKDELKRKSNSMISHFFSYNSQRNRIKWSSIIKEELKTLFYKFIPIIQQDLITIPLDV